MLNWLLKLKPTRLVFLFFSPWILLFVFPLTPFRGQVDMIISLVFLIFWMQLCFYFYFTTALCTKLIYIDKGRVSHISKYKIQIHGWANLLIITLCLIAIGTHTKSDFKHLELFLFLFAISELIRGISISKRIVGVELSRKPLIKEYLPTLYLLMNPIMGWWNIHSRVNRVLAGPVSVE